MSVEVAASANGSADFMAMVKGCLVLTPLIAFHSKKLSMGSMVGSTLFEREHRASSPGPGAK